MPWTIRDVGYGEETCPSSSHATYSPVERIGVMLPSKPSCLMRCVDMSTCKTRMSSSLIHVSGIADGEGPRGKTVFVLHRML